MIKNGAAFTDSMTEWNITAAVAVKTVKTVKTVAVKTVTNKSAHSYVVRLPGHMCHSEVCEPWRQSCSIDRSHCSNMNDVLSFGKAIIQLLLLMQQKFYADMHVPQACMLLACSVNQGKPGVFLSLSRKQCQALIAWCLFFFRQVLWCVLKRAGFRFLWRCAEIDTDVERHFSII